LAPFTRGTEDDKFGRFGLTALPASKVDAPLIGECYASFECQLADTRQIAKRGLFIWDVVKAHVRPGANSKARANHRPPRRGLVCGADVELWRAPPELRMSLHVLEKFFAGHDSHHQIVRRPNRP
jgi:flavin reductase (DIM6/NTAB) family NADH-FMN oxidoreductase RutF